MAATNRPPGPSTAILLTISWLLRPVQAIIRYIGDPNDAILKPISRQCGGLNQTSFQGDLCPALLRCVLDNMPADYAAGMQSGSNVASLVPTITALIGAPPLDLVQMAFLSPHRALATSCFSVGLPSGLFRQLKPLLPRLGDKIEHEPRVREWVCELATSSDGRWQYGWRGTLIRTVVDVLSVALACVMLWYSWRINTEVMVTWRCEYGILVFLWPIACVGWLVVAVVLLLLMKQHMAILYYDGSSRPPRNLGLLQLMALPYRSHIPPASREDTATSGPQKAAPHTHDDYLKSDAEPGDPASAADNAENISGSPRHAQTWPAPRTSISKSPTVLSLHRGEVSVSIPTVAIRITMPHDFGVRSWRWYEAIIEALAVGIYLYATFVLTSAQFMTGEMALTYASLVTLCLSGVRVLGTLF